MWTEPVGTRVSDPRPPHGKREPPNISLSPSPRANLVMPSLAGGSHTECPGSLDASPT